MDYSKGGAIAAKITEDYEIAIARLLWAYEGLLRAGVPRNTASALLVTGCNVLQSTLLSRADAIEV